MKFEHLLDVVQSEPLFETGLLLAGHVDPADVRRQLSRWTAGSRLIQLRRGLYALAPPYQKTRPHPFLVANCLVRGSYVSCQSALAFYGLIPEYVAVTLSVSTTRPRIWNSPLGTYAFRHIKTDFFFGYHRVDVMAGQAAFVARAEKALLDLIYLEPAADSRDYLEGLRLQNLDRLDLALLQAYAQRSASTKLQRAVPTIVHLAQNELADYESL